MRLTAPARLREPLDLSFLGRADRARKRLEIDLGGVEWVSPAGVAGLLAACLGASSRPGLEAAVHLPRSRETLTYLAWIGFLAELERNGWVGDGELDLDPAAAIGPHLPVTRLATENEVIEASYQLQDVVSAAGLSGGRFDELITVVVELAGMRASTVRSATPSRRPTAECGAARPGFTSPWRTTARASRTRCGSAMAR